jgi:hypothetical protein
VILIDTGEALSENKSVIKVSLNEFPGAYYSKRYPRTHKKVLGDQWKSHGQGN